MQMQRGTATIAVVTAAAAAASDELGAVCKSSCMRGMAVTTVHSPASATTISDFI